MRSLESQDENQTSSRQLVLTIAYWMLVILGLIARAHYRMNNAVIETYVKDHYIDYKDDMKKASEGNWIITSSYQTLLVIPLLHPRPA